MNWAEFMRQWNDELLQTELRTDVPDLDNEWLGTVGATDKQISELEKRLEIELPQTYRTFLKFSNGWRKLSWWIDRILPTHRVTWFRDNHKDWIDIYLDPYLSDPERRHMAEKEHSFYGEAQSPYSFKVEYLMDCLQISDTVSTGVFLLNPKIITPEGEWEAWLFDNSINGAERFRSFEELMQSHYFRYFRAIEIEDDESDRD